MIIGSQDFLYEVIQKLPDEGETLHYRCVRRPAGSADESGNGQADMAGSGGEGAQDSEKERAQPEASLEGDQEQGCHLVQIRRSAEVKTLIPMILEMQENTAFSDFREYFMWEGFLVLVFAFPWGEKLEKVLKEEHELAWRFGLGQQILEAGILQMLPDDLLREALTGQAVYVNGEGKPGFYYLLKDWKSYGQAGAAGVQKSLGSLMAALFQKEIVGGMYPELEHYVEGLQAEGKGKKLLELYQDYLQLLPVCSQERKKEKKKSGLWKGLKKQAGRILTAAKICLGLGVLVAAAAVIPGLWQRHVVPVVQAAALWKAVYVDGETLEPETAAGAVEETETGPETDPDNGYGRRFREDGSLCYEGELLNGKYEGKGTLYYADGTAAYEGEFSAGKKEGEGCLYTDGGLLFYEGGFHRNQFQGQGKLYDGDTGRLVYEGGFEDGKYSGEGILYNPETEYPIYTGGFRIGRYDGNGVEYDSRGSLLYEGGFLLGKAHGKGTVYDPSTGEILQEGEFRNGIYVGTGDEVKAGADGAKAETDKTNAGAAVANAGTGMANAGADMANAGAGMANAGTGETNAGADVEKAEADKAKTGPGDAKSGPDGEKPVRDLSIPDPKGGPGVYTLTKPR